MNVFAYNRTDFINLGINDDNVSESTDYYISIIPTGGPKSEPIFYKNHSNVITLVFDDVLDSGRTWGKDINNYYDAIAITKEQAKILHNFLLSIPDHANVHIHCVYGVRRTGAVAKYLRNHRNAIVHNIDLTFVNNKVYDLLESLK